MHGLFLVFHVFGYLVWFPSPKDFELWVREARQDDMRRQLCFGYQLRNDGGTAVVITDTRLRMLVELLGEMDLAYMHTGSGTPASGGGLICTFWDWGLLVWGHWGMGWEWIE
jgi:hypothetical protein